MLLKIRSFLLSPFFFAIPTVIAIVALLGGGAYFIPCLILEVLLIAFILFMSDDAAPAFLPYMCVVLVGTMMLGVADTGRLGSLGDVLPYLLWGIPLVISIPFHFVFYRKPFRPGRSFWALCVASLAILLGGVGHISAAEYFNPTSLYYTLGLSVGLLVIYYVYATEYKAPRNYDIKRYFLIQMLCIGILCTVIMLDAFFSWIAVADFSLGASEYLTVTASYRNTVANLLVMSIPSAFYFAGKEKKRSALQVLYFCLGCLFCFGAFITVARTALLFGSVMLVLCVAYYLGCSGKWIPKLISVLILFVALGFAVFFLWDTLKMVLLEKLPGESFMDVTEARWKMLLASFEDFKRFPIFGIGLGSLDHSDILAPIDGCINWYHLYFPQIWGSMGVVGCFAFGYQLVQRIRLALCRPNAESVALTLSYVGLLLYSQTDPGEFIPVPFAGIAVIIFVLLERHEEGETVKGEKYPLRPFGIEKRQAAKTGTKKTK